jgi:SAM-dependent methyltransferase
MSAASDPQFDRWLQLFPEKRQSALRCRRSRAQFLRYVRQRLGTFMVDVDQGPMGTKEIIMKTAVLSEAEAAWSLNPDNYFEYGYRQLLTWFRLLEPHGFNLRTVGAVLELGCGSARLIRHLRCLGSVRLVGTDLVAEQAAWCAANIPGVEFHTNDLRPPLAFAGDNTFDLAFAASVFTHIPLETQALWIREMHRVLRPGGFLVCDVLGEHHQRKMLGPEEMTRLATEGRFELTASDPKASLSTQLIGSWDVFMTRTEFLRAFRSSFRVLDFVPTSLNLMVLQKPGEAR